MNTTTANATSGYAALALGAAALVAVLSLGATTSAQTVPVSCSVNTSAVSPNQSVTFTATGGTGSYVWSGRNIDITNETGTQFVVTYPNPGVYPITVRSGNDSATCTMTVIGSSSNVPVTPGLPNTGGGYNQ